MMFGHNAQDPLSPTTTAGSTNGVRRLTDKPLLILGLLVLATVAVFGYVMYERSKKIEAEKKEQEKPIAASIFAQDITDDVSDGVIPAKQEPSPLPEIVFNPEPTAETAPMPSIPDMPMMTPMPMFPPTQPEKEVTAPPIWHNYATRFTDERFSALQAALKSKTNVQGGNSSVSSGSQFQGSRPASYSSASSGADPMTLYQEKMAAVEAMIGNTGATPATASGLPEGFIDPTATSSGLQQYSRSSDWTLPNTIENLYSQFILQAGFVIPSVMISGISSDLPGQVMAQVSQNVYDSPTGRYLLIPQGTRLVGTYDSNVNYGQKRVLMAWQRLLFPDGRTLDIQAMPGADASGYSGFRDQVNNHYFRIFGSALLLSGVIAGVSLSQEDTGTDSEQDEATAALSEALGQTLGSTMAEMLRKNMNIAPTLEIRPGYRFNIMVTKDIYFPNVYQ